MPLSDAPSRAVPPHFTLLSLPSEISNSNRFAVPAAQQLHPLEDCALKLRSHSVASNVLTQ